MSEQADEMDLEAESILRVLEAAKGNRGCRPVAEFHEARVKRGVDRIRAEVRALRQKGC